MTDKITFEIEDIGPINEAKIALNKINVIVGKNSSGKSFSSKILYSILMPTTTEPNNIIHNDLVMRFEEFVARWENKIDNSKFRFDNLLQFLKTKKISDKELHDKFKTIIKKENVQNKEECLKQLESINKLINDKNDPIIKYTRFFEFLLDLEFGESFIKQQKHAIIKFEGKTENEGEFEHQIHLIKSNLIGSITTNFTRSIIEYFNFANVIYIDSPSIFELTFNIPYHVDSLYNKLSYNKPRNVNDKEVYKDEIEFKEKIDKLIDGEFEYNPKKGFILKKEGIEIDTNCTSSGLKELGVIQLLLNNYELTKNSFLIIDEPEVHLHPELQVKLAEILVLMAKELNITLYINTHSPFLAEAIEVYSNYYKFDENVNFYLTEDSENKNQYNFKLIDKFDINEIYNNLGDPFDVLNEIRIKTDLEL